MNYPADFLNQTNYTISMIEGIQKVIFTRYHMVRCVMCWL